MREVKYLAHFGKKGQTWYVRNYQSYETVPTRSGKVGEFRGMSGKEYRKDRKDYARTHAYERAAEADINGALKNDRGFRKQTEKYYKARYDEKSGIKPEENLKKGEEAIKKSSKYIDSSKMDPGTMRVPTHSEYLDYSEKKKNKSFKIGGAVGGAVGLAGGIAGAMAGAPAVAMGVVGGLTMHLGAAAARAITSRKMKTFDRIHAQGMLKDFTDTVNASGTHMAEIKDNKLTITKYGSSNEASSNSGYTRKENEEELKRRMKSASTGRKIARAIIPGLNYYDIAKTGSQMKKEGRFKYGSSNEASSNSGYTRKENEEELKRRMKSASTGRKIARAIIPGLNYYDIAKTGSQMKKEGRFKK